MESVLFTNGVAVVNVFAFSSTNFILSRFTDHGAEERKRHDLALEKLQRQEMNGIEIERNALILSEKNGAKAYNNNVDEEMAEYYRIFAKNIKPLPPESELPDFYHPSKNQNNGELLLVAVGTGIATYPLCKYLK